MRLNTFDRRAAERLENERNQQHLLNFANTFRQTAEGLFLPVLQNTNPDENPFSISLKRRGEARNRIKLPNTNMSALRVYGTTEGGILVGKFAKLALHFFTSDNKLYATELAEYDSGSYVTLAHILHETCLDQMGNRAESELIRLSPDIVDKAEVEQDLITEKHIRASSDTVLAVTAIARHYTQNLK